MTVTTTRKEYDLLLPDVERNRAAVAGEREIKRGATKYLPPLASQCILTTTTSTGTTISQSCTLTPEGQASYNKYLSMAYFFGATGRTVDGLNGLIFSKDPVRELPSVIDYLKVNVDGTGQTLRSQAQSSVDEAFITPQFGLLVDFPNVKQIVSVARAESENLRPKILQYKFESIINWHFDVVNNEQRLSLLVLQEVERVKKSQFDYEEEKRFRVLELLESKTKGITGIVYHQTVMDEGDNILSGPDVILVDGNPSDIIPFFFIKVGTEKKAVINDLVDTNLNHYRFFADYAAKEHTSAFPVFWETGAQSDDKNIVIGPGAKWSNVSDTAAFGVIQTESDGGSGRQYLLDQEQRMAALGAEMLKPRTASAESAEAKSLDQVAQNSTTANVAINVSEGYQKALQFAALWLGSSEEVVYRLNTDYNPTGLNPQQLTALLNTWQNGGISYDTFFANLQKGEIISVDVTKEEEKRKIDLEDTGSEV